MSRKHEKDRRKYSDQYENYESSDWTLQKEEGRFNRSRIDSGGKRIYETCYPQQPSAESYSAPTEYATSTNVVSSASHAIRRDDEYYDNREFKYQSEIKGSFRDNALTERFSDFSIDGSGSALPTSSRLINERDDTFLQPESSPTRSWEATSTVNDALSRPGQRIRVVSPASNSWEEPSTSYRTQPGPSHYNKQHGQVDDEISPQDINISNRHSSSMTVMPRGNNLRYTQEDSFTSSNAPGMKYTSYAISREPRMIYNSAASFGASQSSYSSFTSSDPSQRAYAYNKAATTGRTNENMLDPNFQIRPSRDFELGQILKVLWSQTKGSPATEDEVEERANSTIGCFAVVATEQNYSQCLPIFTYASKATASSDVRAEDHTIIYTGSTAPLPVWNETGLVLKPIRVHRSPRGEELKKELRLNYGKIYTVEHNAKVLFIGKIHEKSMSRFLTDFDSVWSKKRQYPPPVSYSKSQEYQPNYLLPPAVSPSYLDPLIQVFDDERPRLDFRGRQDPHISGATCNERQPSWTSNQLTSSHNKPNYTRPPNINSRYSESRSCDWPIELPTFEEAPTSKRLPDSASEQNHEKTEQDDENRRNASCCDEELKKSTDDGDQSNDDEEDPDDLSQKKKRQQIIDRPRPKPQPAPDSCTPNAGCGAGPRHMEGGFTPRPPPAGSSRSSDTKYRTRDSQHSGNQKGKSSSGRKRSAGVQEVLQDSGSNNVTSEAKREVERWLAEYKTWKDVTCACGFGYYTIQAQWISGADVKAGRAPPKPDIPFHRLLMLEGDSGNAIKAF